MKRLGIDMEMKTCSTCGNEKSLSDFTKDKTSKDGLRSQCKTCAATYRKLNKDARSAYTRQWRQDNIDAVKAYAESNKEIVAAKKREYYGANKEAIAAQNKIYRDTNKEAIAVKKKEWKQQNPHKVNTQCARRRASKLQSTVLWDEEITNLVAQESYHLAKLREKVTGFTWHVDHVIPLQGKSVCGLHVWNNLAVIPASENLSKNNSYVME